MLCLVEVVWWEMCLVEVGRWEVVVVVLLLVVPGAVVGGCGRNRRREGRAGGRRWAGSGFGCGGLWRAGLARG